MVAEHTNSGTALSGFKHLQAVRPCCGSLASSAKWKLPYCLLHRVEMGIK